MLAFEARRAFEYYEEVGELVPLVGSVGRPVLLTIIRTYRGLLDEIVDRNYNVMEGRISISHWRKAAIALGALAARFTSSTRRRREGTEPPRYSESTIPLTWRSLPGPQLLML